jgi:hypothetical protein
MKNSVLLVLGFSFFGLMIGYITGITSSEISQTILTALFAFMGGKIFLDFKENSSGMNNVAGAILLLFSILFLIGINTGIYIKINRVLTNNNVAGPPGSSDYLRTFIMDNDLEAKYRRKEMTADSILKLILDRKEK